MVSALGPAALLAAGSGSGLVATVLWALSGRRPSTATVLPAGGHR